MHAADTDTSRKLALIGGGHTHALLLRQLGQRPLRNVRLTLVSDVERLAYSGMLPGHVGGVYSDAQIHIDLRRLCNSAGARFILGKARGLELERKLVLFADDTPPLPADVVSINVGGMPRTSDAPGAEQWTIPAKPVAQLLAGWQRVQAAAHGRTKPLQIIFVGGGAGGVELALAMQSELGRRAQFTIIHRGSHLLSGHNLNARHIIAKVLQQRGMGTIMNTRVVEVMPDGVRLDDGESLPADFIFWATQSLPPAWLAESGLDTTAEGFVRVEPTLQALGHPWVFAVGDVATIEGSDRPRSGVFAVRMAQPLADNLRAYLSDRPLKDYKPQRHSLSLIGTADGRAVASHHWLAGHSFLFWWWKDWIDRRFIRQFS